MTLTFSRLTNLGRKAHLFLAKGPAYHYLYSRWRLNHWLQKRSARSFTPDEIALLTQLDLDRPALAKAQKAAAASQTGLALAEIVTYFRTRTEPVFFFGTNDEQQLYPFIQKEQRQATIQAADQICQNIFSFRRAEPVKFETGIDWYYAPQDNIDWRWDLNRHAYFETLGRAYRYTQNVKYYQKFRELLLDWLAQNPARVNQPNWSSIFEAGFRINSWLWAFYYFRPAFDDDACLALLKGLLAHGLFLDANLELHVQNNHLLLEAKALAMLGLLFPEFKPAERWRQRGLGTLYQQVRAQVCADGVHGEQATLYHRIIAGELLELLVLLEDNQISAPANIRESFARMVEVELWLTKPDGRVPLFGDSALEDTYLRFTAAAGGPAFLSRADLKAVAPSLDETSVWLLGGSRVKRYLELAPSPTQLNSRAFPEGGYFVMRAGQTSEATYLACDCGPFGYKPVPSHGHADALSFELHAFCHTFLVDPGVYGTRLGRDWRNFFRSSRAHNTVVVDNQDQSFLLDIWRVYRPAQAKLRQWLSTDHFDFMDGVHDGYERLAEPISHRRQIFFAKPEYWVVVDLLTGRGSHCFDLYFHLMPDADYQFEPASKVVHIRNNAASGLIIAPLTLPELQAEIVAGETEPIQGWVSCFSGEKQPAPTLRYRQEKTAPARFCTVLYPHSSEQATALTVSPLDVSLEVDQQLLTKNHLTGLQIETDAHIDYLVIAQETEKKIKVFAEYETDAQLIYLRRQKKDHRLTKVILEGGDQLLFRGQPLLPR
jgi:uncharacterized heparinase superfamily protein